MHETSGLKSRKNDAEYIEASRSVLHTKVSENTFLARGENISAGKGSSLGTCVVESEKH